MALPVINLPQIDLPFTPSELMHPAVVHFAIAIPVIVFLIEFYNLFTRRKSVGAFSFILLLLAVVVLFASYLTGGVDAKAVSELLSPEGQEALKAHKILGVYVLFASVGVLFFKLLSTTGKGFFRFLFFLMLMVFIVITFKQGKSGGELVYTHGANAKMAKSTSPKAEESGDKEEAVAKEAKSLELPAVETPVVETPKVETPAVETPTVETPKAETPVVEAPKAETPVVETPAVETPATETPAVEESVEEEVVAKEEPVKEELVKEELVKEEPVVEEEKAPESAPAVSSKETAEKATTEEVSAQPADADREANATL